MSHLVRAGLVFLGVTLATGLTQAAPVSFHFQLTVGDNDSGTPHPIFTGAQLDVTVSLDTSSLVPIVDVPWPGSFSYTRQTQWSAATSTATIKLTGTSSHDGLYPATVAAAFPWDFYDDKSGGAYDIIYFPPISMETGDGGIGLSGLGVSLPSDYFQPSGSTLHPQPISADKTHWTSVTIGTSNPYMRCGAAGGVTGFATAVPEPSVALLASVATFGLVALRRRK